MRLKFLHLIAYGRFTDHRIDLPETGRDLHVVYGPNEAGKSTSLNALTDLLYGIPARSTYNFLHNNKDMRLAAEITGRDGESLYFQRRKGNKDTLLDAANLPLADTALDPFLGGIDRKMFEAMFGLDHHRLRQGGSQILAAQGETGQSLFAAGAAVADLHRLQRGLEAEAADLFKPGGSKPKLNEALARQRELQKSITDSALKADDWKALQAETELLAALRKQQQDDLAGLRKDRSKLDRIRRLAPNLAKLRGLRGELVELAGTPHLPDDAAKRRQRAIGLRDTNLARRDALDRQIEREKPKLEVPPAAEILAGLRAQIDDLAEQVGAVAKAEKDLPQRRFELAEAERRMTGLLDQLGRVGHCLDDAQSVLLSKPQMAALREVAARWSGVDSALRAARTQAERSLSDLKEARAALQNHPAAADAAPLRRALTQLQRCLDVRDGLGQRGDALTADEATLQVKLAALPLWHGTVEALRAVPLPDGETILVHQAALERAEADIAETERRLRELETTLSGHQARLKTLEAGGSLPSREAIRAERQRRNRGWTLIRRRYIDQTELDEAEEAAFRGQADLPTAYEQAVGAVDQLVDSRIDVAERATQYDRLLQDIAEAQAGRDMTQTHLGEMRARRETALQAWGAVWRPAGITPAGPREMSAWLDKRMGVLEMADGLDQARILLARDKARVAEAEDTLRACLKTLPHTQAPTAALMDGAEETLKKLEDQAHRHDKANHAVTLAERAEAEAGRRLTQAEADLADWQSAWARNVAPLGRDSHAGLAEIESMLDLIAELHLATEERTGLKTRITAMEDDIAGFGATIAALAARHAPDLAGLAPAEAVRALDRRIGAAEESLAQRNQAEKTLADLDHERQKLESEITEADRDLSALMDQAGTKTMADLPEIEARSARKIALTKAKQEVEGEIIAHGDGLTLAEIETELAGCDVDDAIARIAALDETMRELNEQARKQGEAEAELAAKRAAMGGGAQAAEAAQARASVLAEIDDTAERFITLRLASLLLSRSIESYRRDHQGPLLEAAGNIFRTLTGGSFSGLQAEYGDNDIPYLAGLRADGRANTGGEALGVEAMSEGTRDQLFLALRLAAIGHYMASARPVPFIADDLLVHFDDHRAAAAFEALGELATRTQVLFFTHNRHMVDLARATLGADGLHVHAL